jgi:hypothetical protein
MIYIDYTPILDCKSLEETYGEICIKCNKCGRFDIKCFICGKIIKPDEEVIEVEFYDVFSCYCCLSHDDVIKKFSTRKYENKFMIDMDQKTFLVNHFDSPKE